MKREILFKAKRVDNGEWVFGNLYIPNQMLRGVYISLDTTCVNMIPDLDDEEEITKEQIESHEGIMIGKFIEVHPETVCQFTGILDKNGNKIFEGDIVARIEHKCNGEETIGKYQIIWDKKEFRLALKTIKSIVFRKNAIVGFNGELTKTGNIYDK